MDSVEETDNNPITHVSDTARWVAMYRAMETDRPDALFRDPYARRLAGEKGAEIIRTMRNVRAWAWPHIVRTATLDEFVMRCVGQGADAVLNLAAGLDARPWRLDLPPTLTWIHVDYPDMLAYVREQLAAERPRCVLQWEAADLADDGQRRALFAKIAAAHRKVLVVSEGLLIYLGAERVAALADDLHTRASFRWWALDIASPRLLKMMRRGTRRQMAQSNAEFLFAPAKNTAFFTPHGWKEAEWRGSWTEALRLKRLPWMYQLFRPLGLIQSRKRREEWNRFAGCALMERV
jgi:methyltransferase (TIGR00027 family)